MAAQNGIFRFIGNSGRTYNVSAYFDDTANDLVKFDLAAKAAAASPDYWQPNEPCVLRDVILAAATGQTSTQILANGQPTGDVLLNAVQLASITTRPMLNLPFGPGLRVSAKQLA